MNAKSKAKQLVEDFMLYTNNQSLAIKCAINCAQEVINELPMYTGNLNPKWKHWSDVIGELNELNH